VNQNKISFNITTLAFQYITQVTVENYKSTILHEEKSQKKS